MPSKRRGGLSKREYAAKFGGSSGGGGSSRKHSRGGMSRREYAAKEAGGTLNYRTGRISVPAKSPTPRYGESHGDYANRTGVDPSLAEEMGYIASPEYQSYLDQNQGKPMPAYEFSVKNKEYNSKKNKSNQPETNPILKLASENQRKLASSYNTLGGKSFLDASREANKAQTLNQAPSRTTTSSPWRQWLDKGLDIAKYASPLAGIGQGLNQFGLDITSLLGVPKAQAFEAGIGENLSPVETEQAYSTLFNDVSPDKPTGYGAGGTQYFNNYQPSNNRERTPNNNPNRVSSPTISPFIPPETTTGISNGLVGSYSPQAPADFSNTQDTRGTVRQFLGNGYLSTGEYGNGAGDYGLEGSMTGTGGGSPLDDLLTVLGLKTPVAVAAEPQMNMLSGGVNKMPAGWSDFGSSYWSNPTDRTKAIVESLGGTYNPPSGNGDITSNATGGYTAPRQQGGGATGGATSPLLSQYDQQTSQQEKAFKAQQKAQKKALKELLKSIDKQFKTDKSTGQSDLEKAKQEDLLKLSGIFSFANQDPNSEQRVQYQTRTTNDYADRLVDFLAKLNQARQQQVSSAKQNYQTSLADLSSQNQTILNDLAEKRIQAQMELAKLAQKGTGSSQRSAAYYAPDGSYTFNETDPITGKKIFYDPNTNEPFYNS